MSNYFDQFDETKVDKKVQKSRDSDALKILKAERSKSMTDSDRDALEREIKLTSKQAGVEYEPPATPGPAQIPVDTSVKAPPAKETKYLEALTRGVNKGYTYGYSAEVEAAKDKALGKGPYGERLKVLKGEEAALADQHPVVSGVGETLGMLLNPLSYVGATLAAKAPRGVQIAANAANQAAVGGAEGYSKNYKANEAALGATVGGIFSILGDTAGNIIQKVGDKAARQMVYDKLDELLTKKPTGWDKTLRKIFNAPDNVPEEKLVKHASDYAYSVKNEKASLTEPVPIVHVSKEEAKKANEASRVKMQAEFEARRDAARKAFEERTGRKVESTMTAKPEPTPAATEPAKTPKEIMDLEDGGSFLYLSDPKKYDELRRERMWADIEKLNAKDRGDVKVMDLLAQKHGFDDHIDWTRFSQGLEKQEPLSAAQIDAVKKMGNAPEGTMGMLPYEQGGGDELIKGLKRDQLSSILDNPILDEYVGGTTLQVKNIISGPHELLPPGLIEQVNAKLKPTGWTVEDLTEPYRRSFQQASAPPNTMGMMSDGYASASTAEQAAMDRTAALFKQSLDKYKQEAEPLYRLHMDDQDTLVAELDKVAKKHGFSGYREATDANNKRSGGFDPLRDAAPTQAPPNTMGMASMPIEQRIEPTFNPDEVVSAAQAVPDSPGGRAFGQMAQTAAGAAPVPPVPQAPWGANAKSVLDNLAPDASKDAWGGIIKSAGGALVGTAAYHTLPEEWKKYSWLLPVIGGAMGAPSGAKAVGNLATNQAMQRAVRGGTEYPQMGVPVSVARNVTNQFIPVDQPPDTSNYFNQFDEQPKKAGLTGLLDRVRSQWQPTAGE